MQISMRAAALRSALEQAAMETATATRTGTGTIRVTVPVPPSPTDQWWAAIRRALILADGWGCTDTAGPTRVWAEIQETA